jgi:low affinity Fe/Cu permease
MAHRARWTRRPPRNSWFTRFAKSTSRAAGRPAAFAIACAIIAGWAVTGPLFRYSDTWQLVVNTGTTVITFLMVFLIQNTQNRDSEAAHVKLDELIRALDGAQEAVLDLEELDDEELDRVRATYERLAQAARAKGRRRNTAATS